MSGAGWTVQALFVCEGSGGAEELWGVFVSFTFNCVVPRCVADMLFVVASVLLVGASAGCAGEEVGTLAVVQGADAQSALASDGATDLDRARAYRLFAQCLSSGACEEDGCVIVSLNEARYCVSSSVDLVSNDGSCGRPGLSGYAWKDRTPFNYFDLRAAVSEISAESLQLSDWALARSTDDPDESASPVFGLARCGLDPRLINELPLDE